MRGRGLAVLAAVGLAASALAGCAAAGDAQRVVDRSRLVNDLASRLAHASTLTYTAVYTLRGGGSATITQAQAPARAAYTYPQGKLILGPEYTADCRAQGKTTGCTLTPPPSPATDVTTALLDEIGQRGLVAPTTVIGLLSAAAMDSNAVIAQHDTTIAGENATCVDVSGVNNAPASQFSACIITAGLLGSFTGTVGRTAIDISLDRYQEKADPAALDLPAGATITDRRPH